MSNTVIYGADGRVASVVPPSPPPVVSSAAVHTDPKSGNPSFDASPILDIVENAREAGCYQFVAETWAVDESHPELTDSIRKEADPRYVPLLCKRIYLTPAGTEISRTYHVIGKYIEFPTEEYKDENVRLSYVPRNFPFPSDKIQALRTLWAPWDTRDEGGKYHHPVEYNNNTPPEVVEIGPWLLEQMKALRKFFDSSVRIDGDEVRQGDFEADKKLDILEAETRADLARIEAAREEARYRMRHNWRQMKEAVDNGRWSPEPPEASPFVDLGHRKEA